MSRYLYVRCESTLQDTLRSYLKLHQNQLMLLRNYPKRVRVELRDFDDAVLKFFNVDRGELVRHVCERRSPSVLEYQSTST